jgi:hypothetical protein
MAAEYYGLDPTRREGLESIKGAGLTRAMDVANLDKEAREIVKDKEVVRELARREFVRWWRKEKEEYPRYRDDPNTFDVELMQRLFTSAFRDTYARWWVTIPTRNTRKPMEECEERILEPVPTEPAARIVGVHHSRESRIYEIELVDPDYPGDRILFEVQVDSHGETELRDRA